MGMMVSDNGKWGEFWLSLTYVWWGVILKLQEYNTKISLTLQAEDPRVCKESPHASTGIIWKRIIHLGLKRHWLAESGDGWCYELNCVCPKFLY